MEIDGGKFSNSASVSIQYLLLFDNPRYVSFNMHSRETAREYSSLELSSFTLLVPLDRFIAIGGIFCALCCSYLLSFGMFVCLYGRNIKRVHRHNLYRIQLRK